MKLFEHPDFSQAILQAAEHFRSPGLRAATIEKDYYVTEALRAIARSESRIIFKGGTSLAKGWNLIQRFSEDIDIFLDPLALGEAPGKRAIDRELKKLRDAVAGHTALTRLSKEGVTIGGFGRSDVFTYQQRFGGPGEVANRVLVEAGSASGREPTVTIELRSYISEFLHAKSVSLGCEDEGSFSMPLLHFRRTFVEKMFAIHGKVELLKQKGRPLGSYARHYYDLSQLVLRPEVLDMLQTPEYAAIKTDYDQISRAFFSRSYYAPPGMSFAQSDALFPSGNLASALKAAYEEQCRLLCYGPYPSWDELQERLLSLRDIL